MYKLSFEKLLIEAVDEELSLLGDSAKHAIYFHVEKTFKIDRCDIPCNIERFFNAIENIFGVGAELLEIRIAKRLYKKIGGAIEYSQEQKDTIFTDCVTTFMQSFLKMGKPELIQHILE